MTYVIGYPRIGEQRELKFALESFWQKRIDEEELERVARRLKKRHWDYQRQAGIDYISSNDFSYYDQMLDTIQMLGCWPKEYGDLVGLDRYFAMARGDRNHRALGMTKWLNTNYHYFVPKLGAHSQFSLNLEKAIAEFKEALDHGIKTKVNLIGPVTFLSFSRSIDGSDPLDHLDQVVGVYEEALDRLGEVGVQMVQLDEPALVLDPDPKRLLALQKAYQRLGERDLDLVVATYFERADEAVEILVDTPIWGIALDLVHGQPSKESLQRIARSDKYLIAGVVDGRNIWISDIDKKVEYLQNLPQDPKKLLVSPSCSLLHVPYTLRYEEALDPQIKSWLAFANEKLDELRIIDKLYRSHSLNDEDMRLYEANRVANEARKSSTKIHDQAIQERLKANSLTERSMKAEQRLPLQRELLGYPLLPTTTIGSFPQTQELRKVRKAYRAGKMSQERYKAKIQELIAQAIQIQEDVGLDVLVHGEFERNDMVEYFGQMLKGVAISQNGWVQSYGSRCVKPPMIYGDVSRPRAMSVEWITYAQSLTSRPVKGMLTGPVTMLNWSFVRDDLDKEQIMKQMALAVADEVADLQRAGIQIIQVDEAAFKEGYPLKKEKRQSYEKMAVESFKMAVAPAKPTTQIHTHMCYSDFNDIMPAIDAMDADVISIETARNGNRLLEAFRDYHYQKEVGAGVYDIHSARVPSKEEILKQIEDRLSVFSARLLWINPDCGLKTRSWEEVILALRNMVEATKDVRSRIIKV